MLCESHERYFGSDPQDIVLDGMIAHLLMVDLVYTADAILFKLIKKSRVNFILVQFIHFIGNKIDQSFHLLV